jgi:molybdopterin-guanine dinucleotide biosynthesis protein A
MNAPLIGIFVGGKGRRMGGVPKGNLLYEGRSILERTLAACDAVVSRSGAARSAICLVGDSSAYRAPGVLSLADEPPGRGPMGGLRALLLEALRRDSPALALANDMPFLDPELLARLSFSVPGAAALAPFEAGRWQPLFARYAPATVLPILDAALSRLDTRLQVLFEGLGDQAHVLELSAPEQQTLRDWDRPSDVINACPKAAD